MADYNSLHQRILKLDEKDFSEVALTIFSWQSSENPVYKTYLRNLGVDPSTVSRLSQIPFLPIELFKHARVTTGNWLEQVVFTSSGTAGEGVSRHYLREIDFYNQICQTIFERFYGSLTDYHLLALLPHYLERQGSSLVHMVNHFIETTASPYSGFFLQDYQSLARRLTEALSDTSRKTWLWGVPFALLDFAPHFQADNTRLYIMETGGMKGQQDELVREELHHRLKHGYRATEVHSEYGMTELNSQAYAFNNGKFQPPPWMKFVIRDIDDPLSPSPESRAGGLNIIDLANLNSCCFTATADLARQFTDGTVEVLGRLDNSDQRGCNLLVI